MGQADALQYELDEHLLTLFATPAAALLSNIASLENLRRVSDDLKRALRARDLVAVAKGVVMTREARAVAVCRLPPSILKY